MRGNRLKLCQWRLVIRENIVIERVVKHWYRLPKTVVESLLEVLKKHVHVALEDIGLVVNVLVVLG